MTLFRTSTHFSPFAKKGISGIFTSSYQIVNILFRQTAINEFDEEIMPSTKKWDPNILPRVSNLSNASNCKDKTEK